MKKHKSDCENIEKAKRDFRQGDEKVDMRGDPEFERFKKLALQALDMQLKDLDKQLKKEKKENKKIDKKIKKIMGKGKNKKGRIFDEKDARNFQPHRQSDF